MICFTRCLFNQSDHPTIHSNFHVHIFVYIFLRIHPFYILNIHNIYSINNLQMSDCPLGCFCESYTKLNSFYFCPHFSILHFLISDKFTLLFLYRFHNFPNFLAILYYFLFLITDLSFPKFSFFFIPFYIFIFSIYSWCMYNSTPFTLLF